MTTGRHCAIKVEPTNAPFRGLHREFAVYERLYGRAGIPTVECYSRGSHHKAMVMELLGPSLEELLSTWKAGFSLKTVLMLGHQLLSLLEYIHSKGIIHRNLKPSAALMGLGEKGSQVHLVSFGLSQWYARHGEHISYREGKPLLCSPLFASLNAHLGVEQGRRDDLESLAYVLIYLLRGKLPWQKSWRISTSELCHEVVRERKMAVAVEDLFEGVPGPHDDIYTALCTHLQRSWPASFTTAAHYASARPRITATSRDCCEVSSRRRASVTTASLTGVKMKPLLLKS